MFQIQQNPHAPAWRGSGARVPRQRGQRSSRSNDVMVSSMLDYEALTRHFPRNLVRAPAAGRNWEGYELCSPSNLSLRDHTIRFGGDPYLSGEAAFETIIGVQSQGVQAVAKHFINKSVQHFSPPVRFNIHSHCSEQEHSRSSSTSDVDDR